MYDYDDDGEGGRSLGRTLAIGAAVVLVAAAGWFGFKKLTEDDGGGEAVGGGSSPTSEAAGAATDETSDAASPSTDDSAVDAAEGSTTSAPGSTDTTDGSTAQATTTTSGAVTGAAASTTTVPSTTIPAPPYATLPDGSPAPVIAVFDEHSITLTGAVPDQAAKDTLQALAVANAKPGQADTVVNELTLNPAVPRNVGVRVVELTSARFPDGSTEILPQHAAELDRIVTIMNALPHTSALIIGHADQRGDSLQNYALSEERALAVKNYVASNGVALERLSSRAVGETDLLTLDDDDAALALNRRTEIVFNGLLLG